MYRKRSWLVIVAAAGPLAIGAPCRAEQPIKVSLVCDAKVPDKGQLADFHFVLSVDEEANMWALGTKAIDSTAAVVEGVRVDTNKVTLDASKYSLGLPASYVIDRRMLTFEFVAQNDPSLNWRGTCAKTEFMPLPIPNRKF